MSREQGRTPPGPARAPGRCVRDGAITPGPAIRSEWHSSAVGANSVRPPASRALGRFSGARRAPLPGTIRQRTRPRARARCRGPTANEPARCVRDGAITPGPATCPGWRDNAGVRIMPGMAAKCGRGLGRLPVVSPVTGMSPAMSYQLQRVHRRSGLRTR